MKKIISLLLALIMCITLAACGSNGEKPANNDTGSSNQSGESTNNNQDKEDNYEATSDLPGTLRINLENVKYCVDAPSKQIFNKGYNFVNMDGYFVVYDQYEETTSEFIYEVDKDQISKPSEVLEGMKKQFIAACSYGLIKAPDYDFTVEYEDVKINQWDMSKFSGVLELKFEVENPQVDYTSVDFVGYSLIKDGCPVYFVVIDIPTKNGVDNIEQMADKIAKTFREYTED